MRGCQRSNASPFVKKRSRTAFASKGLIGSRGLVFTKKRVHIHAEDFGSNYVPEPAHMLKIALFADNVFRRMEEKH